jgi:hypothetical protein
MLKAWMRLVSVRVGVPFHDFFSFFFVSREWMSHLTFSHLTFAPQLKLEVSSGLETPLFQPAISAKS